MSLQPVVGPLMLTLTGDNPLNADAWVKNPEPVFQREDEHSVFGPGHNGFFKSPDGTEDWIVYHANDLISDGCDNGRTTRVQKFTWNDDGTPNFGVPVDIIDEMPAPSGDMGVDPMMDFDELEVSRLRSYNSSGTFYLRSVDTFARLDSVGSNTPPSDTQFYIVPGLADPDAVSIMSIFGAFLCHEGNNVFFNANDGSEGFAADATWWFQPGLADATAISIESYNQPGMYIGRIFGTVGLVALTDESPLAAREDATFIEEK